MPETAEPEVGNIAHLFDKVMPMEAEDMEGGEAEIPASPAPVRTREDADFQQGEPQRPSEKKPEAAQKADETTELPDFLFGAEKKPAEVVPESKEPVKEEAPEGLKGKARENFDRIATAKFEAEKKAHDLEKRLKEAEDRAAQGDPNAKARIEALEKQVSSQSELVARANLEMHPEFQARYTMPRQQALEAARGAIKDSDADVTLLDAALQLKGKAKADKLDELYESISSKTLRGKVERAVDYIETLDANKDAVMQNASVYAKQLQEAEQVARAKQTEEYETNVRSNLKEAETFLKDKYGLEVLQTVDDPKFSWWNDQAKKISDTAESIMLKVSDPKQLTIAAHLAAACVPYRTLFKQEREQRLKLEKQLKDLRGSEPTIGGDLPNENLGSEEEEDEKTPLSKSILGSIKKYERRGA